MKSISLATRQFYIKWRRRAPRFPGPAPPAAKAGEEGLADENFDTETGEDSLMMALN
jgi:hypothetical protein